MDDLLRAIEDDCWQRRYYYDCATREVVCVTEATRAVLQAIYDEVGEHGADVLLPDALTRAAHAVEMDDDRFLRVPSLASGEKLRQADRFAATADPALRPLLYRALDNQDEAQFERSVGFEPAVRAAWEAQWRTYLRTKVAAWLSANGC